MQLKCFLPLLAVAAASSGVGSPQIPDGLYRVGGGVSAPIVISKREPAYSEEARKAKVSGTVVLRVVVSPDGKVSDTQVVRSLGYGLDEKAIEAVETWRFRPGMKDGQPVSVFVNIEVNFALLGGPGEPGSVPPVRPAATEEAIALISQAIRAQPDNAQAWLARGRAYAELGQPEKAFPDLDEAIRLMPKNKEAYEHRANAHMQLKEYSLAIADYTAAIELYPTRLLYQRRSEAKRELGDRAGADADQSQAAAMPFQTVSISPSDPIDTSLPAPRLISPPKGAVFDVYPRRTTCGWEPSPGAVSYIVETDYSYNGVWASLEQHRPGVGYPVQGTEFSFDFVGAQPGRWRVWPVNAAGQRGTPSEWRTFRYTR